MSQWGTPTRADLETFVKVEGWIQVRDAKGRTGTHHHTYELALPDGRILRTRISHPVDRSDIGTSLFSHILRDQLAVDQATFWAAVTDGVVPDRGGRPEAMQSLPLELTAILKTKVGLSDEEIAALDKPSAIARIQEFWTLGR